MDKKRQYSLIMIVSVILMLAGIICLCISLFGSTKSNKPLACALICINLANLLNIYRAMKNKNKS